MSNCTTVPTRKARVIFQRAYLHHRADRKTKAEAFNLAVTFVRQTCGPDDSAAIWDTIGTGADTLDNITDIDLEHLA